MWSLGRLLPQTRCHCPLQPLLAVQGWGLPALAILVVMHLQTQSQVFRFSITTTFPQVVGQYPMQGLGLPALATRAVSIDITQPEIAGEYLRVFVIDDQG